MKRILKITALVYMVAAGLALAGPNENPCWYSGVDGFAKHNECLESPKKNVLRIKPSHLRRLQFDGNFATVLDKNHGWLYVNRKGEIVAAHVMSMDNGADYVRDGFVRYEYGGKCGYVTLDGPGTIVPRFDGCMPFNKGIAHVCNGCRSELVGEHHEYKGGESFCIDVQGKRVACGP